MRCLSKNRLYTEILIIHLFSIFTIKAPHALAALLPLCLLTLKTQTKLMYSNLNMFVLFSDDRFSNYRMMLWTLWPTIMVRMSPWTTSVSNLWHPITQTVRFKVWLNTGRIMHLNWMRKPGTSTTSLSLLIISTISLHVFSE